jgi:hypothetical protein
VVSIEWFSAGIAFHRILDWIDLLAFLLASNGLGGIEIADNESFCG